MTNFPSSTDLSKAVARTRASYDETPYASAPLARQQPARVAAAALWFGLRTPPVRTARVPEISCASGGDAYIAHEIFEDDNAPLTFGDFCAALDRHGLAYVGECNVAANREDGMAPAGAPDRPPAAVVAAR